MKPFKNLKVVELASVLAGPSVGLFFAELGAKVVKIENKSINGDVTRSWKLPVENQEEDTSAYFYSVNRLKKHLFLDLKDPKDRLICFKELKKADVVITNFKKGDDKKLNLDFDTIKKINDSIIYASINGFGKNDARSAYDLILQAESGFMSINGEESSAPLKMPVAFIDLFAGHQLKEAILIALIKRDKIKKAQKITVSLFDSAIASLANQATNWLVAGFLPKQQGSMHPNIAPYGEIFTTKDQQQITFAIGTNKQFLSLIELIGIVNEIPIELLNSNKLRVTNRMFIAKKIQDSIARIDFDQIYNVCLANSVPIGKIRNIKEALELKESKRMIFSRMEKGKLIKSVKSVAFEFGY